MVKNPNEPKLRNTGNVEGSTPWRVRILVALTGVDDDGGPGTTTSERRIGVTFNVKMFVCSGLTTGLRS